jgi:hypothetical protein
LNNPGYNPIITVTYIDSDTIRVDFDPALPDVDCCNVILNGDAYDNFHVRTLAGDINLDGVVTGTDPSIIKPHLGDLTDGANFIFDFNADGAITGADFSLIKPLLGNIAPDCP